MKMDEKIKNEMLSEFLAVCGDLDARDKVAELLERAYAEGFSDCYYDSGKDPIHG